MSAESTNNGRISGTLWMTSSVQRKAGESLHLFRVPANPSKTSATNKMPGGRPRCRFEQHEQSRASMKLLHCCCYLPVLVLPLALAGAATDFDFFFHVQQVGNNRSGPERCMVSHARRRRSSRVNFLVAPVQWRGSYCNTRAGCCFPGDQKPAADFGIHGLWPNYADCRRSVEPADDQTKCWPDFCNATDPLNTSRVTWGSSSAFFPFTVVKL
jgi:hypothetical protein